jgi:hypothetical protein
MRTSGNTNDGMGVHVSLRARARGADVGGTPWGGKHVRHAGSDGEEQEHEAVALKISSLSNAMIFLVADYVGSRFSKNHASHGSVSK